MGSVEVRMVNEVDFLLGASLKNKFFLAYFYGGIQSFYGYMDGEVVFVFHIEIVSAIGVGSKLEILNIGYIRGMKK